MWLVSKWIDSAVGKRIAESDDLNSKLDELSDRIENVTDTVNYVEDYLSGDPVSSKPVGDWVASMKDEIRALEQELNARKLPTAVDVGSSNYTATKDF